MSDGIRATGPPLWERAGEEQASLDIAARKQPPPSLPSVCLKEKHTADSLPHSPGFCLEWVFLRADALA